MNNNNSSKVYQKIISLLSAMENCKNNNNNEWLDKHEECLFEIEKNLLPSGSGFDSGTKVVVVSDQKEEIRLESAFHSMDENGFYCGWTHFEVVVKPSLAFEITLKLKKVVHDNKECKEMFDKEFVLEEFYNCLTDVYPKSLTNIYSQ